MTNAMNSTIDPARVAQVVREVVARLRQANTYNVTSKPGTARNAGTQTNNTAVSVTDKVITVATIEQLAGNPKQIFISAKAIVTPAAKDAVRERGIEINRSVELPKAQVPNRKDAEKNTQITDAIHPERAIAITSQLSRRGIESIGLARIVLSETPSLDVYQHCSDGQRSVMVTSVADIQRFDGELKPTVWVLDMKRMNWMSAVNAAAAIARLSIA